jgi:hypothetical protein
MPAILARMSVFPSYRLPYRANLFQAIDIGLWAGECVIALDRAAHGGRLDDRLRIALETAVLRGESTQELTAERERWMRAMDEWHADGGAAAKVPMPTAASGLHLLSAPDQVVTWWSELDGDDLAAALDLWRAALAGKLSADDLDAAASIPSQLSSAMLALANSRPYLA